jgi:S-DNA-T family DNA segregation ATPase FtsK/SpoIIIE
MTMSARQGQRARRGPGALAVSAARLLKMTRDAALWARLRGLAVAAVGAALLAALASYHAGDPSLDASAPGRPANLLGVPGADVADLAIQTLGLAAWAIAVLLILAGVTRLFALEPGRRPARLPRRVALATLAILALAGALGGALPPASWPLTAGLGGLVGDGLFGLIQGPLAEAEVAHAEAIAAVAFTLVSLVALAFTIDLGALVFAGRGAEKAAAPKPAAKVRARPASRRERRIDAGYAPAPTGPADADTEETDEGEDGALAAPPPLKGAGGPSLAIKPPRVPPKPSGRAEREIQPSLFAEDPSGFRLPELALLAKPKPRSAAFDEDALTQNARLLESVLAEFGVRGQIDQIRPGPVVTLYELAPAPGIKSSRVISLSDDIARSMSVAACRVSVVPGRNAIGIELPNARREMVYLRDLLSSADYEKASQTLPMALGETIGGEPYIVDLAKMPHLLIAGTTGSGKSVGVNAMILSILYRLTPEQCRFIMIDPKMLELSVYDGIPHLLAPVVTDPKKAVVALKWTVREMEDRYRKMSKIGVRNVAGYNERAREALAKGEHFVRTVQTGFDEGGRPIFEEEKLRPEPMPFLVVVIDEVADLMMVAGKDIEGAVQRLAQMARAAGIHLIMATQRPSVDVITGTIKANFPTRISFQVTSKIDSRTIMGEQGAEQLLGMGDMLYMAGGGRITRLHGPFVSDGEVETVAKFLRDQGEPQYLDDVTASPEEDGETGGAAGGEGESGGNDLYDQAVAVVTRDRKASTSYVQRRLQIGYNRAASLIERMEKEGVVGAANHAGKREILAGPPPPP